MGALFAATPDIGVVGRGGQSFNCVPTYPSYNSFLGSRHSAAVFCKETKKVDGTSLEISWGGRHTAHEVFSWGYRGPHWRCRGASKGSETPALGWGMGGRQGSRPRRHELSPCQGQSAAEPALCVGRSFRCKGLPDSAVPVGRSVGQPPFLCVRYTRGGAPHVASPSLTPRARQPQPWLET